VIELGTGSLLESIKSFAKTTNFVGGGKLKMIIAPLYQDKAYLIQLQENSLSLKKCLAGVVRKYIT
jgi:hypothetical protein